MPTAAELANAPLTTDFLVAGGNVPFNGTDPVSGAYFDFTSGTNYNGTGALASPYFNDTYVWGDYGNAPGAGGSNVVPWWGQPGAVIYSESLVVRSVPEPATWAMMLAGFAGLGFAAFRRTRVAA